MTEVSNLVSELRSVHDSENAWHGPGLKKILTGVPAGKALERSLSDYRSIWELVLHIAKWEEVFRIRLEGQLMTEPDEGDWPPVNEQTENGWQKALEFLDDAHERLINVVSKLKESDLSRSVPGKDYTIGYMLHGIVRHHVYHAGQIALLKRMAAAAQ